MRPSNEKRFSEQHPGHTDDGHYDEQTLKLSFAGVQVSRLAALTHLVAPEQDHVDEGDENGGRATFGQGEGFFDIVGVVFCPLDEHQKCQVPEEGAQEQDLEENCNAIHQHKPPYSLMLPHVGFRYDLD